VELVPETRNIDLTRREADLAIRFSRPVQGGLATRARKLGALQFGLYCAAEIAPGEDHRLDWIGYDDSAASLPQAIWTEALRRQSGGRASALRVTDIETALAASVAGHGKAVLPRVMCLADDRLRALPAPEPRQEMARDVWLLSHADQTANLSIEAAKTWLTGLEWR
jgi:DNA-binding transcriptional LysR family regulator